MLSTISSHESKTTTQLSHDLFSPSLASFSRPRKTGTASVSPTSAGPARVLSTVHEASASEATTPELHGGPQAPVALATFVPMPAVPVPPRRSSIQKASVERPSGGRQRGQVAVAPGPGPTSTDAPAKHKQQQQPQPQPQPQRQQQHRDHHHHKNHHNRRRKHRGRAAAARSPSPSPSPCSSSSASLSSFPLSSSPRPSPSFAPRGTASSGTCTRDAHAAIDVPQSLPQSHVPVFLDSPPLSAASRRHRLLAANASFPDARTARRTTVGLLGDMADNHSSRHPLRDSHDLSLSPRDVTRDSLVTNMLMSLDQMSSDQAPTHGSFGHVHAVTAAATAIAAATDHEPDNAPRRRVDPAARFHRHRPSYGSEHESPSADQFDDHLTGLPSVRGRCSDNGPKNVQSLVSRSNDVREPDIPPRNGRPRGGRHSAKSSSSASIDMGYLSSTVNQRLAQRTGRSASIDAAGPKQSSQLQQLPLSSPFRVDFPDTFANAAEHAAAPTPTVPGGPRRAVPGPGVAPSLSHHPPPPPPPAPTTAESAQHGRTSSRSVKGPVVGARRGSLHHMAAQSMPALPSAEIDSSAPAPSVGYGKSKKSDIMGKSLASQQKDRPGFFRRVFGSSRTMPFSNGTTPSPQMTSSRSPSSLDQTTQQLQLLTPSSSAHTALPSGHMSSSHPHPHPHPHSHPLPQLQKKTSSFFRRRRKPSVDEAYPLPHAGELPPLPTSQSANGQNLRDAAAAVDETSSTAASHPAMSSCHRENSTGLVLAGLAVSTPLSDVTNTPNARSDTHTEARHNKFSPGYQPSPNAHIRKVEPEAIDREPSCSPSPTSKPSRKGLRASSSFLDLDAGSDPDDHGIVAPTQSAHDDNSGRKEKDDTDHDATIRGKLDPLASDLQEGDRLSPSSPRPAPPAKGDAGGAMSFASGSTEAGYQTAPSVVVEEASDPDPKSQQTSEAVKTSRPLDEPGFVVGEPTEDDCQKAKRIYDGDEVFISKEKSAAWMGEQGPVRQRTLQAYMALYDFKDVSILSALRQVCGRLILRAETQQVDRILIAFSKRWCVCNPKHGFRATDVIHMICYSIMLLNTDLHVADIEQKMTRSQFVKNTMTTILQVLAESTSSAFDRPSILPEKNSVLNTDLARQAVEPGRSSRHSFRPPLRSDTTNSSDLEDCGPLVRSSFDGPMRAWQEQVETVLKSIYSSIREERLPLFGAEHEKPLPLAPSQGSSLSVLSLLKRSPSVMSKAPSETQASTRGRVAADSGRTSTSRWTSKSRSRPGLGRTGLSSSHTSFDDGNSIWTPAMSSATWSRQSLGRTQGSMSQDSFGSSMPRGDYQQSIGFATALSQAIIRDEDAVGHDDAPSVLGSTQFLEDESLELAGPPWVKEGMVVHKHHLDGYGKRAKDRNWTEVFAVVQKGNMSLFSFSTSKSLRQKSRLRGGAGRPPPGPVGGGNWQDNAVSLGTFNLRLTLASALPPPGYSRSRPHVWALSLPTGAVHLFQVGTPEIIREFVNTANYWSARLSTHPLVGGISNIEYGWSEAIVNDNALVSAAAANSSNNANDGKHEAVASVTDDGQRLGSGGGGGIGGRAGSGGSYTTHGRKSSIAGASFRGTSFDHVSGAFTSSSGRAKTAGDRLHVAEWMPPTQSMRPSNAPEGEQLQALMRYVKGIEQELQSHNQLRGPMMLAFTPRGHNGGKAMANWERKSAYLLHEIVKFRTYVDCLQQAEVRKREIYSERDLATKKSMRDVDDEADAGEDEDGDDDADETLCP